MIEAGNCFKKVVLYLFYAQLLYDRSLTYFLVSNFYYRSFAYSYAQCNPENAVRAYSEAIDAYNENGRFGQSARYYKEIGEVLEADNNIAGALDSYQQAANMFNSDNKKSNANQCLLKVAALASANDQFSRAGTLFVRQLIKKNPPF